MQTNSRNGKFIVSASDDSKTGSRFMAKRENIEFDEENDVYLKAIKDVTLLEVAETIYRDCFDCDCRGLHLLAKFLKCHVTIGQSTFHFNIDEPKCLDNVLRSIAFQLKL